MAKFKVGDKVRILDGRGIDNYEGGFTSDMVDRIGEVVTIKEVHSCAFGSLYVWYCIEPDKYSHSWDERGLELATDDDTLTINLTRTSIDVTYDNQRFIYPLLNKHNLYSAASDSLVKNIKTIVNYVFNKKLYTGKVICVKNYYAVRFTVGKIYTVCDGVITDDIGNKYTDIESLEYLNDKSGYEFIELVE